MDHSGIASVGSPANTDGYPLDIGMILWELFGFLRSKDCDREDGFGTELPEGKFVRSQCGRARIGQASTGHLHFIVRIRRFSFTTKKTSSNELVFFVVGEDGFEPSKRNAADLQSVPFGHSGTPPYSILFLEPVDGLGTLR